MYVKVRPMNGKGEMILTLSKLTKVEDFRLMIEENSSVPPDRQRLFFHGKQLEDGHAMYDYGVNINDVIQLMERAVQTPATGKQDSVNNNNNNNNDDHAKDTKKTNVDSSLSRNCNTQNAEGGESAYYRIDDLVDACHDGSWWEARIVKITPAAMDKKHEDGCSYHVHFEKSSYEEPSEMPLSHIRPRASKCLSVNDLNAGDVIMVNYNIEEPKERGYWYHAKVEQIADGAVVVSLQTEEGEWFSGCVVHFTKEMLAVPDHIRLEDRQEQDTPLPVDRVSAPSCKNCSDNPRRKCKECGCCKCGGKQDPEKQLMCDECDQPYHIYCLPTPLEAIPDVEEWFCPGCKNDETEIVRAGEKLKDTKKRANMVCKKSSSTRDWGKGYACAGRTKKCTIVPDHHHGPIPGVEVGSQWLYRIQASEAGVHRPPVSGIHGRADNGAYSIVLSGGYEDDEDRGDTFTYTGAGGRDLSGNKRTAEQSCDQTLTLTNLALARNTNCELDLAGGDAGADWKGGKQLRVIRSYKGQKHSKYAPTKGVRYDGIYKVCKYWQETGKSGFKVIRYEMKRDDPIPAPWTKAGIERIAKLGLVMQLPEGMSEEKSTPTEKKKGKKRKASNDDKDEEDASSSPVRKAAKIETDYSIEVQVLDAIAEDKRNTKIWEVCKLAAKKGYKVFVECVESEFGCICCQELLLEPVTTTCGHNVCLDCIKRSFQAKVYTCPACRFDLEVSYKMPINKQLFTALKTVFPGYRGTQRLE